MTTQAAPAAAPTTAAPSAPVSSNATPQATTTPAAAPAEKVRVRSYERARNVKAKLEEESTSEPAGESEDASGQEPRHSSPVDSGAAEAKPRADKPKAPEDEAAAKRRAERAERMAKALERERAEDRERRSRQHAKPQVSGSEIESLRKRIAELEPNAEAFKDEESLLAAAEARGMSAEKLVQWMKTRLSDPNAVAQRHAKTEADRVREELAQLRREAQEERERLAQERREAEATRAGMERAYGFIDRAKGSTESHPLTASMLARHGDRGLIAFANHFVAPMLREDYSLEELHDHLEQFLDELQVASGGSPGPASPASGASHPPKNGAAIQPSTTLSNSIASERGSVTEATPLHMVPRRDRIARLKAKLGGA